jgi:3-deoxy-7-phosphoheptulonate synthase
MKITYDVNVERFHSLIPPQLLKKALPLTPQISRTVLESRNTIKRILQKKDRRLLAIVGPCSIHDSAAAFEYAQRLNNLRQKFIDRLFIVMRVYFEKPRTTVGWKGLIADPRLDGSCDIPYGLKLARRILLKITAMGMPAATEMLDPIVPQYTAGLVSWAAIGARTTESQTHREMASGLSMPVGFKNSTDGNLQIAIDAMESARHAHSFLGINAQGQTCVVKTKGNSFSHLILRGGRAGPNYTPICIRKAEEKLFEAGLKPVVVVDCSHANSEKKQEKQENVLKSILRQRISDNTSIVGFMLESNLFSGNQPLAKNPKNMSYGVSITDECTGWKKTEKLLGYVHNILNKK